MLSCHDLCKYYKNHKDEFPVSFGVLKEGTAMLDTNGDILAYLDSDDYSYEVFPCEDIPYTFIYNLKKDSATYGFEFNEDDAKSILTALVDCTYLALCKFSSQIHDRLNMIDGGE